MLNGIMESMELLWWSIVAMFAIWPVMILLILHLVAAFLFTKSPSKFPHWFHFVLPFVFPIVIALVGGFFSFEGHSKDAPLAPQVAVHILLVTQVMFCLFLIYWKEDIRWFRAATYLWAIWLGFWCLAFTRIALTNTWFPA
jgi:hypothetical protein